MNGGKEHLLVHVKIGSFSKKLGKVQEDILVQGDKKIRDHLQSCWHDIIRFLNSGCEQSFKLQNTVDCVLMC